MIGVTCQLIESWRGLKANDWVREEKLRVRIAAELPLAQAGEAHRLLEGRRTSGKVLLIP